MEHIHPSSSWDEYLLLEDGPWILSVCSNGNLEPVPFTQLRKNGSPVHLTCLGKSENIVAGLIPEEGAFYLKLDWAKHKDATVHEAAPFVEMLLVRHVPPGSRVLFFSFSAGCFWTLIADQDSNRRRKLYELGIECRLVVPNAAAIKSTDACEIVGFIRRSSWVTLTFTIHDWAHKFNEAPKERAQLQTALQGSVGVTSKEYFEGGSRARMRVVYIGNDEEVEQVSRYVAEGKRIPGTEFALHGNTQSLAHNKLLAKSTEPFKQVEYADPPLKDKRAYLRTLSDLIGDDSHDKHWHDEFRDLVKAQNLISREFEMENEPTHKDDGWRFPFLSESLNEASRYVGAPSSPAVGERNSVSSDGLQGKELVEHVRKTESNGYYDRQIKGMVADGWEEDAAAAVRMLPAFGGIALGRALKLRDSKLAASLHAISRGIASRAREKDELVAPLLYAPMKGFPELRHYGLCDQDPAAKPLEISQMYKGATMAAISPPLTLRDDPQLLSEHGIAMYHFDDSEKKGRHLLTGSDIVCFRSEQNNADLHTAVLTNGNAQVQNAIESDAIVTSLFSHLTLCPRQVPTYALPPNTLLTLKEIHDPPFEATFRRWHR